MKSQSAMMNQFDVPAFIAVRLPQVKQDLRTPGKETTIYQSIQVLTDYTKRMAIEHNFKMVEKCMALVEKIYDKGNTLVRNAVENVFIFSFSSIMTIFNIVEWRIVQSYMPAGLYTLYIQQVLRSRD
jgi:hypothetical protein